MADVKSDGPVAISPQFNVHIVGDDRMLLLSEARSFQLHGKLYVDIARLMDGHRSYDEILRALRANEPEKRVRHALDNMLTKGYARYLDAEAPPSRQAFWVEMDLYPTVIEPRRATASLAVRGLGRQEGADAVAAEAQAEALRAQGITVVDVAGADVVLVLTDDYLDPRLIETGQALRVAGKTWIPFKPGGGVPWIGPAFAPDRGPCLTCLAAPLSENRPGDAAVAIERASRPYRGWTAASLTLARGWAALEVDRHLAGDSDLEAGLLAFDLKTREVTSHVVRRRPHCPGCGAPYDDEAVLQAAMRPFRPCALPILANPDGGWRAFEAADTLARLEPLVSPISGLIAGIEDTSPAPDLPVVSARHVVATTLDPRSNRKAGRPWAAAGKGASAAQAKVSCLAEAVERYCCGWTGFEPRRRARMDEFDDVALDPRDILHYSERQYAMREAWNETAENFHWVGERFDDSRTIEWTPIWSMTQQRMRWIPSRFCYYGYHDQAPGGTPENRFCDADSNGCASGASLEEAIVQGFLELIERDACALWWYNRLLRPKLDLDGLQDPFVERNVAFHHSVGREIYALDLTHDFGIPVFVAISHDDEGGHILMALGAHFDASLALSRALAELNQLAGSFLARHADLVALADNGETIGDDAARWYVTETLESQPYVAPAAGVARPIDAHEAPDFETFAEVLAHCVDLTRERGLELLVLDHTRPGIDFHCARVVVPGLRHFWRRLAPGRLYDVPATLGWTTDRPSEPDLNPISFFL